MRWNGSNFGNNENLANVSACALKQVKCGRFWKIFEWAIYTVSQKVTGPSLVKLTCISAAKRPVKVPIF